MKLLFIVIIFLIFFQLFSTQCIPDKNCLSYQGNCINNKCECFINYWTLNENINENNNKKAIDQNFSIVFCNYERKNKNIAFFLELFFPSLGHFYTKKYIQGLIKLLIWITVIILFTLYCCVINKNDEEYQDVSIQDQGETVYYEDLKGDEKKRKKNFCHKYFIYLVFGFFGLFLIFHIIDLLCFKFAKYKDGKNVPLY